jgi:two-component system, chemotaxis family, CheB/CheR fusion protein
MVGKPHRAERLRPRPAIVTDPRARNCVAAKSVATKSVVTTPVATKTVITKMPSAQRLRHQSVQASSVVAASSDPVIVTDHRGLIDICNPPACRLIGRDEKALIGRRIAGVLDDDDPDIRRLRDLLSGVEPPADGTRLAVSFAQHGRRRHFDVLINVFACDTNLYRVATLRDITELHDAQAELASAKKVAEESSWAKTNFLAKTSHEARTPLNAIVGFSEAMLSGIYGPLQHEKYSSYVRDIHTSGVHLLALINDIFDVAKVEAGELRLREQQVDVVALISSTINVVQPIAAKAGVEIVFEFKVPGTDLRGDERRIRQVLINILSNAIKFSPRGRRVRVSVLRSDAGGLAVVVADRGVGITPQIVEKIGTEFVTSSGLGRGNHDGTGLGLPVSIALMRAHDGELRIETAPGKGTTVSMIFPPGRVSRGRGEDAAAGGVFGRA